MQKLTTKGLAAKLGLEYAEAQGLMKFLVVKRLARDTGEVARVEGAKGKGSVIYEVDDIITLDLKTPEVKGSNPDAEYQELVEKHGSEENLIAAAAQVGVDL